MFAFLLASVSACAGENIVKEVNAVSRAITMPGMYEASITLTRAFRHPYDTDEIDVGIHVTTPQKNVVIVPAFFTGADNVWKVRYTPSAGGTYSCHVFVKTGSGTEEVPTAPFEVTAGPCDGFIRKNRTNPFYPVFDSGRSFFGIGHNIAWVPHDNPAAFEKYFAELEANGGNLARVWLNTFWCLPIETVKLGSYNLKSLDALDKIIAAAEKHGIYLILTLDSYGSLMAGKGNWGEGAWNSNPYNKQNNGPCETPQDFFSDPTAKKFYKNRLRCIIARVSHSRNIFAFELWNEMDAPSPWTAEITSYLKAVNPHGQMTTTSLGYPWGNNIYETAIGDLPDLDIISEHIYGNLSTDIIGHLISVSKALTLKFQKPLMVSEFGLNVGKDDRLIDPSGEAAALHASLWASAFSGCATTALNWWWDSYIRPKKLYSHYKAFSEFIKGIDWNTSQFSFLAMSPVTIASRRNRLYENVTIPTREHWAETTYKIFTVRNNGDVDGGLVNYFLHGMQNERIRLQPVFYVNYPGDGTFDINVGVVSQGAHLIVYLDNRIFLERDFPAGPDKGPWKRSMYRKDFDIHQCVYDTTVSIPVSRGKHIIRLANTGIDWLGIKDITLTGYAGGKFAYARALGVQVGTDMLVWIQSKYYTWQNMRDSIELPRISGATVSIGNVENGKYRVEWWNTFTGSVFKREQRAAYNGTLRLEIPEFSKDLAAKITKS